jgi:hypothetical protein
MTIKYKNKDGKPVTLAGIKSISLNDKEQFVCIMESGSEVFIPQKDFLQYV